MRDGSARRGFRSMAALCIAALLAGCGRSEVAAGDQWFKIANTADGGAVEYVPSSIKRNPADGTTDITVKVTYPDRQIWTVETKNAVEQRALSAERVTLRFNCAANAFTIVERLALDEKGYVKETINPPIPEKGKFTRVAPGGIASVAIDKACRRPAA